jgi:hypothetical protein
MSSSVTISEQKIIEIIKHYCCNTQRAHMLDIIWNKLPQHLQNKLDGFRFCNRHFPSGMYGDVIDGPPSIKFNCLKCRERHAGIATSENFFELVNYSRRY